MKQELKAVMLALGLGLAGAAQADVIVLDFENIATTYPFPNNSVFVQGY